VTATPASYDHSVRFRREACLELIDDSVLLKRDRDLSQLAIFSLRCPDLYRSVSAINRTNCLSALLPEARGTNLTQSVFNNSLAE